MEHIRDVVGPPIVGRIYLVPCVMLAGDWWPINGPEHADPDLGVAMQHVHYDGRFMTAAQIYTNNVTIRRTQRIAQAVGLLDVIDGDTTLVMGRPAEAAAIQIVHQAVPGDVVVERPRRCRRAALTFPAGPVQAILEPSFKDVKTDCRTCPHRGMRIDQQPQDDDGGVVCPGHGLRWHRPSGRLMSRDIERAGPLATLWEKENECRKKK